MNVAPFWLDYLRSMPVSGWPWKHRRSKPKRTSARHADRRFRPFLEGLEDRTLLSVVSPLQDQAGNTLANARDVGIIDSTSQTFQDSVSPVDGADYYRLALSSRSNIGVGLDGLSADADVRLLTSSGSIIASSINGGSRPEAISRTLDAGTYHVLVTPWGSATTNYNLTLSADPVITPPDQAGNSIATARDVGALSASRAYQDYVGSADGADYYVFTLPNTSEVRTRLDGLSADADIRLLNSTGGFVASSINGGTNPDTINRRLDAGRYFLLVYPFGNANTTYTLTLAADPVIVSPPDGAGNTLGTARDIGALSNSRTFRDSVGSADRADYYRFTVSSRSNFQLRLDGMRADADVALLNGSGRFIASSTNGGNRPDAINRSLEAGTYFVNVYPYRSASTNYTLTLGAESVAVPGMPGVPTEEIQAGLEAIGRRDFGAAGQAFGRALTRLADALGQVDRDNPAAQTLRDAEVLVRDVSSVAAETQAGLEAVARREFTTAGEAFGRALAKLADAMSRLQQDNPADQTLRAAEPFVRGLGTMAQQATDGLRALNANHFASASASFGGAFERLSGLLQGLNPQSETARGLQEASVLASVMSQVSTRVTSGMGLLERGNFAGALDAFANASQLTASYVRTTPGSNGTLGAVADYVNRAAVAVGQVASFGNTLQSGFSHIRSDDYVGAARAFANASTQLIQLFRGPNAGPAPILGAISAALSAFEIGHAVGSQLSQSEAAAVTAGAASGALLGSATLGPAGGVIGGLLGAVGAYFGAREQNAAIRRLRREADLRSQDLDFQNLFRWWSAVLAAVGYQDLDRLSVFADMLLSRIQNGAERYEYNDGSINLVLHGDQQDILVMVASFLALRQIRTIAPQITSFEQIPGFVAQYEAVPFYIEQGGAVVRTNNPRVHKGSYFAGAGIGQEHPLRSLLSGSPQGSVGG